MLTHLIVNGRVKSVTWSQDGTKIASGSNDRFMKVWNAQTGQCESTHGHPNYSRYVAAVLNSCLFSNVWCVLTITDYSARYSPVHSVCFSPDGKQVASGSVDKDVKVWQVSTGTYQSTLSGHSG